MGLGLKQFRSMTKKCLGRKVKYLVPNDIAKIGFENCFIAKFWTGGPIASWGTLSHGPFKLGHPIVLPIRPLEHLLLFPSQTWGLGPIQYRLNEGSQSHIRHNPTKCACETTYFHAIRGEIWVCLKLCNSTSSTNNLTHENWNYTTS